MLLLLANFDSFTHNVAHLFALAGADVHVVRADAAIADLLALEPDEIVVSPGPGHPRDAGASVGLVHAAAEHGIPLQWRAEAGTGLRFNARPWQTVAPSEVPQVLTADLEGLPVGKATDVRIVVTDGTTMTSAERTQLPAPTKPAPISGVSIRGTGDVGRAVRCDLGRWAGTRPFAIARQWLLAGRAIAGASDRTYTPNAAQSGETLACRVTVSGAGGITKRTTTGVTVG